MDLKLEATGKAFGGWAGHHDVTIALAPLDLQGTTDELEHDLTRRVAAYVRCNSRRTSSRATGKRLATATFPYAHVNGIAINPRELDICSLRKGLAGLDKGTKRVDELEVSPVNEGHGMGIAHRDTGKAQHASVKIELRITRDAPKRRLGATKGRRNLKRLEYGSAHVDGGTGEFAVIIEREADGFGAGKRIGDEAAGLRIDDTTVDEELRETTHAVAAHLSLGAIGIVVIHVCGTLWPWGGLDDDHAIGSDAKMPIANCRDLVWSESNLVIQILNHDKVIAKAIELCKIVSHVRAALSI